MDINQKEIYVFESWSGNKPNKIGTLYVDVSKGKENFSFEYEKNWLESNQMIFMLDPDIFMYRGRQFTPTDKTMFGVFSDSCPDRWGRVLMKRREAVLANRENRKPRAKASGYRKCPFHIFYITPAYAVIFSDFFPIFSYVC